MAATGAAVKRQYESDRVYDALVAPDFSMESISAWV